MFSLTANDWEQLSQWARDGSTPKRVRARAHALLLMRDDVEETIIESRTGLTPAAQRTLRKDQRVHGIGSVTARSARASKFPTALIAKSLRHSLESRPPEGCTRWDIPKLTAVIRETIPAAASISSESVRLILRKELGIESIRKIEPFWLMQIRRAHRLHPTTD